MKTDPQLLTKFLITGGETLKPAPRTPQSTQTEAVSHAMSMLKSENFQQDSVIIWKPCMVLRREIHCSISPVVDGCRVLQ